MKYSVIIFLAFTVSLLIWTAGCEKKKENVMAPAPTQPASAQSASEGKIVAVGDSLTEGCNVDPDNAYPERLERKLRENGYPFSVVNAGISGETSSGALSRLEWIMTLKPDIVILETGANDGLRGLDPNLTRRNIEDIIAFLQKKNVVVVLAGMQMVRNMGAEYTEAFGRIYPEIAQKAKAILIPFFLKDVAGEPGLNQGDGIHPTAEGYAVVTETVYPFAVEAIETWRKR